jgi:hypothetical protein
MDAPETASERMNFSTARSRWLQFFRVKTGRETFGMAATAGFFRGTRVKHSESPGMVQWHVPE